MNESPTPPPDGAEPSPLSPPFWYQLHGYAAPYGPPPPGAGRVRRRRRTRPALAAALVVGTVAASTLVTHELWPVAATRSATAGGGSGSTTPSGGSGSTGTGSSGTGSSPTSAAVSSIASKVSAGLVDIDTTFQYQSAQGAGTGIVLTSTGEILTNNHVIDGATSISVTDIGNGRTYSAKVVGYDATDDIAVLQLVGASGLRTATIGNSDRVKVGQTVVAVGNAGGTGGTPTASGGTVTALNQAITASDELDGTSESLSNLIETDADVQAGDSGGSLVDAAGQVVGVDSAAAEGYSLQSADGSTSQGYAIPINKAMSIAKAIEAGRSSSTIHVGETAFLGVLISSNASSYSAFGASNGYSSGTGGAVISGVVSGGPAADAGLGQGDVITAIGGKSITSAGTISQLISEDHPGQSIQVTWSDSGGTSHASTVTLEAGPPA